MTTGEKTIDLQTMVGEVKAISGKGTGFKLDVSNEWFNFSQYGNGAGLAMPPAGALIKVECTAGARGGYWVDNWEMVQAAEIHDHRGQSDEQVAVRVSAHLPEPGQLRDERPVVTRLACLKSAIAALTAMDESMRAHNSLGGNYLSEPVILGLAERFVTWVTWGGGAAASGTIAANAGVAVLPEVWPENEALPTDGSGRSGLPR